MNRLSHLSEIIDKYDVFLIDQWGVLHNGVILYPNTIKSLQYLQQQGKTLITISNSSRRKIESSELLIKFDIFQYFKDIITSGELCWKHLKSLVTKSGRPLRLFVAGNGLDDESFVTSCGCILSTPEEADYFLVRGTCSIVFDPIHDNNLLFHHQNKLFMETIQSWLGRCVKLQLPLIVANPDVIRPGSEDVMPGFIAKRYLELLSQLGMVMDSQCTADHELNEVSVKFFGKPYDDIYEHCFGVIKSLNAGVMDKSRIAMIGDSLEHDITGAVRNDIDSIWITNGIHSRHLNTSEASDEVAEDKLIGQVINSYGVTPTHCIPNFTQ